jgi:hypothetical protein
MYYRIFMEIQEGYLEFCRILKLRFIFMNSMNKNRFRKKSNNKIILFRKGD